MKPQITHIAKARCRSCKKLITSKHGGDYVECPCGKSYIDQERRSGAYLRLGGEAQLLSRKCPPNCKIHN